MAKLSAAQDKALRMWRVGEFPMGTNKRTVESLVNNGYVTEDNTFYNLTDKGREYLGLPSTPILADVVPAQWIDPRYLANNIKVWQNLTVDEIRKDIGTAVPVGRASMRHMRNHVKHNH